MVNGCRDRVSRHNWTCVQNHRRTKWFQYTPLAPPYLYGGGGYKKKRKKKKAFWKGLPLFLFYRHVLNWSIWWKGCLCVCVCVNYWTSPTLITKCFSIHDFGNNSCAHNHFRTGNDQLGLLVCKFSNRGFLQMSINLLGLGVQLFLIKKLNFHWIFFLNLFVFCFDRKFSKQQICQEKKKSWVSPKRWGIWCLDFTWMWNLCTTRIHITMIRIIISNTLFKHVFNLGIKSVKEGNLHCE